MIYPNQAGSVNRFNGKKYYLPKSIIRNYNIIANRKNFYDHLIDSDIKRFEEIRKLMKGEGEDYTTGCLFDYEYIKDVYKLIAVDLSKQKELIKSWFKINLANIISWTIKKYWWYTFYVFLNNFRKNLRNETNIFSRMCNSLIKDGKLWRSKN